MNARDPQVAWFGKHPAWPDFMPHFEHPPTAKPLRDWVKNGRHLVERIAPKTEERGAWLYLLSLGGDSLLYCGVIGPSRDASTNPIRIFPLTIYVPLLRRRYRRAYPLLPAYAVQAWDEMRAAYQKAMAHGEESGVLRVLKDSAPSIPAAGWGAWRRFRHDVSSVGSSDFLATLHPEGKEKAIDLIARLAEAVAPFRDGRLGPPTLAFDLPGSGVLKTAAYQAAFWLRLCESILGRHAGEPSLFLQPSQDGRRLGLFLREPSQADYAFLLTGIGEGGTMHRPDGEGGPLPQGLRSATEELVERTRSVADLFSCRWDRLVQEIR